MKDIFNEKYRPDEFEDVIGLDPSIKEHVTSQTITHMLFSGPPGTGKTTTAKIIAKKLNADVLVLNASKDRGIDTIRERIEPFALKASDTLKIVFLDEFDATTPAFQTALRNFMETHARNTRFIATCNYLNKIIPPLRSRFSIYHFGAFKKDDVLQRLHKICQIEGIEVEDGVLESLVNLYQSDIRQMINVLNKHVGKRISKSDIVQDTTVLKVLAAVKDKKWVTIREELRSKPTDYVQLIQDMDRVIFAHKNIPENVKRQANLLFAEYQFRMNFSFNQEIAFAALLGELCEKLQW